MTNKIILALESEQLKKEIPENTIDNIDIPNVPMFIKLLNLLISPE